MPSGAKYLRLALEHESRYSYMHSYPRLFQVVHLYFRWANSKLLLITGYSYIYTFSWKEKFQKREKCFSKSRVWVKLLKWSHFPLKLLILVLLSVLLDT